MRGACCVSSTLTCLRGLHVQWFFAFDLLRQKFVHTKLSQSKNRQTSNLHATKSCQAQFPGDRVGWSEKRSETGWRNELIKPALHSHPRCYMGNFQPGWPARQVLHPHTDTQTHSKLDISVYPSVTGSSASPSPQSLLEEALYTHTHTRQGTSLWTNKRWSRHAVSRTRGRMDVDVARIANFVWFTAIEIPIVIRPSYPSCFFGRRTVSAFPLDGVFRGLRWRLWLRRWQTNHTILTSQAGQKLIPDKEQVTLKPLPFKLKSMILYIPYYIHFLGGFWLITIGRDHER
jgi:hypothetical protein